jgi:two-component system chemotaxis sensor kinase CheA
MDDLLREFLTETGESLDAVDRELVRFEQEPNNAKILDNIFRLVHTIKGTCGFLTLPRLEALTHSAETLMGSFRTGRPVSADAVSLILTTIDRIKSLLAALDKSDTEPEGDDRDLIAELETMASEGVQAKAAIVPGKPDRRSDESQEDSLPHGKSTSHSIRVHVNTLERLMTMVSELVLTRNQLLEIVRKHGAGEFNAPLQRLSHVTAELQEGVLKTRMQPIGNTWQKLPRLVRDLSSQLGKGIELDMSGGDTELDRQVLDHISDPLLHLVRNAADHGLEPAAERLAAGKSRRGTIRVWAGQEGGQIIIEISDDGRGLDLARIRAKAAALGLASQPELVELADAQVHRFIFAPGFSTVDRATNVSGRGVGLDVVRANVEQIGGSIDVNSVQGRGTTFTIKIPLTLAIATALLVECAGERFAIPQAAVVELVRPRNNPHCRIERIKDTAVLRLRDQLLPLTDLKALLRIGEDRDPAAASGFIAILQVGNQRYGVGVDRVLHSEEIVVKPMASRLRNIAAFSGNTILGDGSVVLIVDPNGLAQSLGLRTPERQVRVDAEVGSQGEQIAREPLLIFRAGSPNPKAVPLALVSRLEEIDAAKIEISNGRAMLQYRGGLMPLVSATGDVRLARGGRQPLVLFSDGRRSMGLMVDEIVDIVEEQLEIELASKRPGLIGSALIGGQAVEIIDIGHFLPLAFEDEESVGEGDLGNGGRRILLIEPAEFFRNMLVPVLKAARCQVTAVANAKEAIELVRADAAFDLVVADGGAEVVSELRSHAPLSEVPVIGLSSALSLPEVERGRRAGVYHCVARFDHRGLVAAINQQTANLRCA